MFGSRRNRIRQDIVRKVAPMFHFEALERLGGVLDNAFYTDPYVLDFL